jgi:UDP-N-acetyl-D-glucosamine dehydrogenase
VGLPLIIAFEHSGFKVTGFDIDPEKIGMLNEGKSYVKHITGERIKSLKEPW